jgi:transcriptional regulator with XRE-family HTH domain
MGIDPPALSRLETGKMLNPTLPTLHKWAEALGQNLNVDLSPSNMGRSNVLWNATSSS